MRVLQLTSSFPRRDGDVSGLFIRDVAAAIAAAGIDVTVVAPHDRGAARHEVLDGVHVHRFRYGTDAMQVLAHRGGLLAAVRRPSRLPLVPLFLAGYLLGGVRAARRVRPDVVHAHWWFPGGLVAVGVARAARAPLVITLHGSDVHIARRRGLGALARWVLRRADAVAVVSDALHAEVLDQFDLDPARVAVVRMPVTVSIDRSDPAPPPPPPLRLVAVGRLAPEKGFDVLVDALHRSDAPVELDVFGDGPERPVLEAAAPNGVRFHGARSRREIADVLRRAHALVVPSRREGLGMVALEALALGRPVIASRVGGLVETVEDGVDGVLVPAEDPEALAAALRRLPLPAPTGAAVERHLPTAVAEQHARLYERAISARS